MGAPFGVGYYIWKSMIPTALGNFVGGGLFVAFAYWYLYLSGEDGVQIAFDIGSLQTAIDGSAGPQRITGRDPKDYEVEHDLNGVASSGSSKPRSGGSGQLLSNYGREMADGSPCKMNVTGMS